jgi:plasmid stabilization system protein ParE
MNYDFHPDAREEYLAAVEHYRQVNPPLATGFLQEIEHAIAAIRRNPTTWRVVEDDVRRYLVHRFPYGIYYTVDADRVTIWAVMHLSREPDYWKSRRQ